VQLAAAVVIVVNSNITDMTIIMRHMMTIILRKGSSPEAETPTGDSVRSAQKSPVRRSRMRPDVFNDPRILYRFCTGTLLLMPLTTSATLQNQ
jgi:hypothetical protein